MFKSKKDKKLALYEKVIESYLGKEFLDLLEENGDKVLQPFNDRRDLTLSTIEVDCGLEKVDLPPEHAIYVKNSYQSQMTESIRKHGGFVEDFVGDYIYCIFGLNSGNHSYNALHTAMVCNQIAEDLSKEYNIEMKVFTGIHTGQVFLGSTGSGQKLKFQSMGENVRMTNYLTALNRVYKTRTIISDSTRARLGEQFSFRELDQIDIENRGEPMQLFELLGQNKDAAE